MKKVKYPGVLGNPRKYVPLYRKKLLGDVDSENTAVQEILDILSSAVREDYLEELNLKNEYLLKLMDFYEIDIEAQDKWYQLTLKLAEDHVPCFHFEKAERGRPRKWDSFRKCELITRVEEVCRINPNMTEKSACEHLRNKRVYIEKGIYTRYLEAKKELEN